MRFIEIAINEKGLASNPHNIELLKEVIYCRQTAEEFVAENRYMDALERIVEGMKTLREFSDFDNIEFRAILLALLFDLSEVHFLLKDYKQSEKEIDIIFKVLEGLLKVDVERFGEYHVLAMELSTRIMRSRKKAMTMLAKQQMAAGLLYDKVNSGVANATDKLVDTLRNIGDLLSSTGDYRAALKFYAEAIKLSKKRAGRVTKKEIELSIDMAKIMMRVRSMRPRAGRLLEAVLSHAISMGEVTLEEDILALIEILNSDVEQEPKWKMFFHKLTKLGK